MQACYTTKKNSGETTSKYQLEWKIQLRLWKSLELIYLFPKTHNLSIKTKSYAQRENCSTRTVLATRTILSPGSHHGRPHVLPPTGIILGNNPDGYHDLPGLQQSGILTLMGGKVVRSTYD